MAQADLDGTGGRTVGVPGAPDPNMADRWCEELVARVQPGGLGPKVPGERAPEPSPKSELLPRYVLLEPIGNGGVGEVWRGRHVELDRDVAIKLLHRNASNDVTLRQRFIREAKLASAIRHRGIVDVLDFGISDAGRPFLVMELLEGRSLLEELQVHRPMAWERAKTVVLDAARALAHAHAHGVIHRDLKPSNIMLARRPGADRQRCILIDFGLAKAQDLTAGDISLTATGQVFGTPAYMSPEQFRGEEADARSDVYALGCILHELLVGERPFKGTSAAELMYQHLLEPPPSLPRGVVSGRALGRLRKVLARACHKSRHRRYESAESFAAALGAVDGPRGSASWPLWVAVGVAALGTGHVLTRDQGATPPVVAASVLPAESPPPLAGVEESADRVHSLHASSMFTCALSEQGNVQCWGRTGSYFGRPDLPGHVGDDELPSDVPMLDFGDRSVVALAVSYSSTHLCALLDDGTARCWGDNSHGQLGLGEQVGDLGDSPGETPGSAPPLPLEDIHEIYTQSGWTCALTGPEEELSARCWGLNLLGQLGQGHRRDVYSPPSMDIDFGSVHPTQLALGIHHGCAIFDDGTTRCWGSNGKHQLGNGLPTYVHIGDGVDEGRARGTALPTSREYVVRNIEDLEVVQVEANGGWGCVLSADGRIRCWGGNMHGCLGYRYDQIPGCLPEGRGTDCPVPSPIADVDLGDHGGSRIVEFQQGRQRVCTLDDRGAVRCWGHATSGALGYGSALDEVAPAGFIGHLTSPAEVYARLGNDGIVDIGDFDGDGQTDRVVQLAVGYDHACVLVEDQSVRCWGGNDYGQLGYGTLDDVGDDETPAEYYRTGRVGPVSIWPGH